MGDRPSVVRSGLLTEWWDQGGYVWNHFGGGCERALSAPFHLKDHAWLQDRFGALFGYEAEWRAAERAFGVFRGSALTAQRDQLQKTDLQLVRDLRSFNAMPKRIDLALDVEDARISPATALLLDREGRVHTRLQMMQQIAKGQPGQSSTETYYRQSKQVCLRIYDKRVERIAKTKQDCGRHLCRIEIELHHEVAESVWGEILKLEEQGESAWNEGFAALIVGALFRFWRPLEKPLDRKRNKQRADTNKVWAEALGVVRPLRYSQLREEVELECREEWQRRAENVGRYGESVCSLQRLMGPETFAQAIMGDPKELAARIAAVLDTVPSEALLSALGPRVTVAADAEVQE
jgi:hypothetical protein